jgi:hypothetical protein
MKWLNCEKIKVLLVVFVAAIVLCGGSAKADFTFGEPVNMGQPVNSSAGDQIDCLSADGLEMYISSQRRCGRGNWEIWVSKRETIADAWGTPTVLDPPVNIGQLDQCAGISPDGLELYFMSNRSGGYGQADTWVVRRNTINDAWDQLENLGPSINTSGYDGAPCISSDGLELYFDSDGLGGYGSGDIYVARRPSLEDPWGDPENLGPIVNSWALECWSNISADGLVLVFSEDIGGPLHAGGFGKSDLWMTRRSSLLDPWSIPVNLGPMVNSPSLDCGPKLSPDGSMLYFSSDRPGSEGVPYGDIYQAPIIPIVDFNGDGNIDTEDLLIMIDNWGTDDATCDIGPMPWGDGVVDIEDLKIFMEYWEQENMPQEQEE